MSDETVPRSLRLAPEEWAAFRTLQQQLQERSPYGTVSLRETFRVAVGSTSAALASGQLPVAITRPALPLGDDQAA